jgi:hypothetical protein
MRVYTEETWTGNKAHNSLHLTISFRTEATC